MQCVVLAAGKGTRLHPVSEHRSKAMAPVAGLPMIGHIVEMMRQAGVQEFVFVAGPGDEPLGLYASRLRGAGLAVTVISQAERLGMAHALSLAAPYVSADNFVLTACDNLVPVQHVCELLAVHVQRSASATLSLMHVEPERVSATGIVDWRDGRILRIVEKPTLEEAPSDISSLPLYVFSREVLDTLPSIEPSQRGEYELQDAIQTLIMQDGLVTGVFTKTRRQLTNRKDLLALNRQSLVPVGLNIHGSTRIGANTVLVSPVLIDSDVVIGADCTVGPNVYLEAGTQIADGVSIRNAISLKNSRIAAQSSIVDTVVV